MKRTLWVDTHTSYDPEKLTNTEYNLREDIQCLKEDIRELVDASKIMHQALLEVDHAQVSGPDWYTRGASGLYQQVSIWVTKGLKAAELVQKYSSND